MKVEVYKCEKCQKLFEDDKGYNLHIAKERALTEIDKQFPELKDSTCDFTNGHYSIQRNKDYYENYKDLVIKTIKQFSEADGYTPMSYGWFRCLDDGRSIFRGIACRILYICPKCYKEWGQQYYANNCCKGEKC